MNRAFQRRRGIPGKHFQLLAFLFGFLSGLQLEAQQAQSFQGDYFLGARKGEAQFAYRMDGQDTILQGDFQWQSSDLEDIRRRSFTYWQMQGHLENGLPAQQWFLRRGRYKPQGQGNLQERTFVLPLSGGEWLAQGAWSKGQARDEWSVLDLRIDSSAVSDTLLQSVFHFAEGQATGSFQIASTGAHWQGQISPRSRPVDTWRWKSKRKAGERLDWIFDQGELQRLLYYASSEAAPDTLYRRQPANQPGAEFRSLEMNERFFTWLRIMKEAQQGESAPSAFGPLAQDSAAQNAAAQARRLWQRSIGAYERVDSLMTLLAEVKIIVLPRARLRYYALSEDQEEIIRKLRATRERIDSLQKGLLQNAQVKLQGLSHPGLAWYRKGVDTLRRHYGGKLDSLEKYLRLDLWEYLPPDSRARLLEVPREDLSLRWSSRPQGKWHQRSWTQPILAEGADTPLGRLSDYAQALETALLGMSDSIQHRLQRKAQAKELVQLEDSLMQRWEDYRDVLDSLQLQARAPVQEKELWQAFLGYGRQELEHYSALEDDEQQRREARRLLECLEAGEAWARTIAGIPPKLAQMENVYTRKVWNPYTYTDMEEQVKERLYRAYREKLIPYYLKRAREEQDCGTMERYRRELKRLHERMLDLREERTDRLERKIKRRKEAPEIMELLKAYD